MCGPSSCIDASKCKTMKLDGIILAVVPCVGARAFLSHAIWSLPLLLSICEKAGPKLRKICYKRVASKSLKNHDEIVSDEVVRRDAFLESCTPRKTKRKTSLTKRKTSKTLRNIEIFGFWGVLKKRLSTHHQNAPSPSKKTHGSPKISIFLRVFEVFRSVRVVFLFVL